MRKLLWALLALGFCAASPSANAACRADAVGSYERTCDSTVGYLHSGVNQPVDDSSHPLPVTVTAGVSSGAVAQGSTTSGQSGQLVQGATVSGDQIYTAGTTNPLTTTASGRLRVGLSSAGSVTPGTAGTNSDLIAGVYQSSPGTATDGQQRALQQTAAGNLKVDGSAVTQPVSGTVAASNLPTTVDTNSGNKSASTLRVVIATDQPQNTTALKVDGSAVTQPISGAVSQSGTWNVTPLSVTTTDKSGTISSGGVAQSAIALNASRKAWCIQNDPAATETLYVRVNGTAAAGVGSALSPGDQACNSELVIDTAAVSVFAATTGHIFEGFEKQ